MSKVVDVIYSTRDSLSGNEREEFVSAIQVIVNSFRKMLGMSAQFVLDGKEVPTINFEEERKAMKYLSQHGVNDIPEELTDEAVKVFVLEFGRELLYKSF